jgi:hypothetical protein
MPQARALPDILRAPSQSLWLQLQGQMDFAAAVPLPHAAAVSAAVSGSQVCGTCSTHLKHGVLGIIITQMHTPGLNTSCSIDSGVNRSSRATLRHELYFLAAAVSGS